jgi:DNA-binding XRE family transcriptional regulator
MLPKVSEETERLLNELEAWANEKRGRRAELARILGVDRSSVTDWFKRKSEPNWETGLKIQAFLKKQRRKK